MLVAVAALAVALWLCLVLLFLPHCERRIRAWADQEGYSIIRLEYRRGLWGVLPFVSRGTWYVRFQDEQGGQRTAHVHFGSFWMDIPGGTMLFEWQ